MGMDRPNAVWQLWAMRIASVIACAALFWSFEVDAQVRFRLVEFAGSQVAWPGPNSSDVTAARKILQRDLLQIRENPPSYLSAGLLTGGGGAALGVGLGMLVWGVFTSTSPNFFGPPLGAIIGIGLGSVVIVGGVVLLVIGILNFLVTSTDKRDHATRLEEATRRLDDFDAAQRNAPPPPPPLPPGVRLFPVPLFEVARF